VLVTVLFVATSADLYIRFLHVAFYGALYEKGLILRAV